MTTREIEEKALANIEQIEQDEADKIIDEVCNRLTNLITDQFVAEFRIENEEVVELDEHDIIESWDLI